MKCKPLGGGASVLEESEHFAHWLANKITVPGIGMGLRKRRRLERLAKNNVLPKK